MNKVGVLGGTFDPFHYGHLSIAHAAMEELNLSKMILLPTKVQPFKLGRKITNVNYRIDMLNLIAHNNIDFNVSTIEAYGDDISYTYNTLTNLQNEYPDSSLYFILGTDSIMSIENWYKGKELLNEFYFILGKRPGYRQEIVNNKINCLEEKYKARIYTLNNIILEISSTEIKNNIKDGISISKLVPPEIERYIVENELYR